MTSVTVETRSPGGLTLLDRAFQILELFDEESSALSQAQIIRATGLPKSTVSRLVRHLCARGYLVALEARTGYGLGPAAMELGRRAMSCFDLREIAGPWLERLSQVSGEAVMLAALDSSLDQVACVDQVPGREGGLQVFERVGSAFALNAGAVAKAVLAFMTPLQQDRVLRRRMPPITPATKCEPEQLREEIRMIQARGYAISHEETYVGVSGVGVPFFGPGGRVMGSMAIAGPMYRMPDETLRRWGRLLCAEMAQLSHRLGAPAEAVGRLAHYAESLATIEDGRHHDQTMGAWKVEPWGG